MHSVCFFHMRIALLRAKFAFPPPPPPPPPPPLPLLGSSHYHPTHHVPTTTTTTTTTTTSTTAATTTITTTTTTTATATTTNHHHHHHHHHYDNHTNRTNRNPLPTPRYCNDTVTLSSAIIQTSADSKASYVADYYIQCHAYSAQQLAEKWPFRKQQQAVYTLMTSANQQGVDALQEMALCNATERIGVCACGDTPALLFASSASN
jgi:hypothetical protein